jgi:hypothetical protein
VEPAPALDAVLPLVQRDLPRAQMLFRTLEWFFEPLRTCYVVAPDGEVAAVRTQVPHGRYETIAESDVVPELPYFALTTRIRAKLRLVGPPLHGWYAQQLVKLAVAEKVATRFCLTLDADVLCVRLTRYDDLVRDGRALVQTTPPNHPEWNDDAERVLGLPRSGRQYAVTPALLSSAAVSDLAAHLHTRVDPRLRSLSKRLPPSRARDVLASWRSYLVRSLPWTEYALYHTFLEQTGRFDRYHALAESDEIYGNCVWMESQFEEWDVTARGAHRFSVVQSATRIPPEQVWARVEPRLRAAA